MLVKYVRNSRGHKIGVVVAINATEIGWSLCNAKMGDIFNSYRAIEIAVGRAKSYALFIEREVCCITVLNKKGDVVNVPISCKRDFYNMVERARRYFQLTSPVNVV